MMSLIFYLSLDTQSHIMLTQHISTQHKASVLFLLELLFGKLLRWIQIFLEGRLMRAGIRGSFSDWTEVLSGVPQGSVLGPLLFLLFVNDLPDWIKNSIRMFADDVKIWNVIRTDAGNHSLQEDLSRLARWSSKWLLKLNSSKWKVMHISHDTCTEYHLTYDDGNSNVML